MFHMDIIKRHPNLLEEFKNISELIKDVIFVIYDFSKAVKKVKKGDFVYLDPPYAPKNATSFVGYTKDGFDLNKHKLLFDCVKNKKKNIKFTMSNSNVPLVTIILRLYNGYNCGKTHDSF